MSEDKIMKRLAQVEQGLEQQKQSLDDYKSKNDQRNNELDVKLAAVQKETLELQALMKQGTPLPSPMYPLAPEIEEEDDQELLARADNVDQYGKDFLPNGIFVNTNGYRFNEDNANPADAFIEILRRGRDVIFKLNRDAEGKVLDNGEPTNNFVSAHPLIGIGAQNGREVSNEPEATLLPTDEKRQYGYPAYDLEEAARRVGLPARLDDIKHIVVKALSVGSHYGFNTFLDLYLHEDDLPGALPGYEGTINAVNGNFTKSVNINAWFVRPTQTNSRGLANGWAGAKKVTEVRLSGGVVEVGVKRETVNGNDFLYVTLIPTKENPAINFSVSEVLEWARGSMFDDIDHEHTRAIFSQMKRPPRKPSGKTILCGLYLGPELWWTKSGLPFDTLELRNFSYTINGRTFYIDGTVEGEVAPSAPTKEPEVVEGVQVLPPMVFKHFGEKQNIGFAGWEQDGGEDPNIYRVKKNQPLMIIQPRKKGKTTMTLTDAAGVVYTMDIEVK